MGLFGFELFPGARERKELVKRVGDLERQVKDLTGRVESLENSLHKWLDYGEELLKVRITAETTAKSMGDLKKSLEGCRHAIAEVVKTVESVTLKVRSSDMMESLEKRERSIDRRLMNN